MQAGWARSRGEKTLDTSASAGIMMGEETLDTRAGIMMGEEKKK